MRHILLILLLLLSFSVLAQIPTLLYPEVIDSLSKQLPNSRGKEHVDVLNGLALYLAPRYYDSSLKYANEAMSLAERLNYEKGKGVALFNAGNSCYFRMDLKKALTYYLDALRILEDLEPSQELGNLYYQVAIFTNVPKNCRKAMQVFNTIHNHESSDFVRMRMLTLLGDIGYDSVIYLGKKNLEYFRKEGNSLGIYMSLIQVANACFYQNQPLGLKYAYDALALAEEIGDDWLIANALHKVVNYNKNDFNYPGYKTNYKLAESDLQRAKEILVRSKLPYRHRLLYETYRELGDIYRVESDFKKAIQYYNTSIATVDTFSKAIDTISFPEIEFTPGWYEDYHYQLLFSFSGLRSIYAITGNYKMALEQSLKYDSVFALIRTKFSNRGFDIMQAGYEDAKQRDRIDQLRKEREIQRERQSHTILLYSIIGGAVIILLLAILFFLQSKKYQSDRKALLLEQKLLRSQMNPHFLFNALTGIQNFILTQKPDQASIYLSKFANLVRNILDNSVEEFVTLEKEISTIENYLELQKVRYAGKFEYRITIADAIDPEELMIPPMLAQPFIENSIEHGIKHRETPGHLDIRFSLQDHTLVFEVEDDGVGRQKAREISIQSEPAHRSMATSLTRDRLATLNRKLHNKIILEITDLKNALGEAGGTRVMFAIPVSL